MKNYDVKLLKYEDEQYPECLRNIHTPPIKLYCMGNINLLNKKRRVINLLYAIILEIISSKILFEDYRLQKTSHNKV